ncbi:MAG: hypothetical protein ACPG77_08475 [Nannocystaceae bacterium]
MYALFDSAQAAEPTLQELSRNCEEHQAFAVQVHDRSPLEADHLPEAATQSGRNILIAALAGMVIGGIASTVTSMILEVPGIGPGIVIAFGLLAGPLVGMVSAMMAGHREPKAALREAATELGDGAVLLVVATDSGRDADWVETYMAESGSEQVGVC